MKYIVDLPDTYTSESALFGDILSIPICLEGGKRYGIPTGIKLEPYTEPNEDNIRNKVEDEVWDFVSKFAWSLGDKEILGMGIAHAVRDMTYQEAKTKYEAWKKQKDEIRVGDEVIYDSCRKGVVLKPDTEESFGIILTSEFSTVVVSNDELEKTGRHFEIEDFLKKLKD